MVEVRFYHLQTQSLDQALPAILTKAFEKGHRIVVKCRDQDTTDHLNEHLWTFNPNSFLPHGSEKDGNADKQPIWLTADNDNPNNADVLVVTDGTEITDDQTTVYKLCCDMFDGTDNEAVQSARTRWKTLKENGIKITYWQQDERGGWSKKAEEN